MAFPVLFFLAAMAVKTDQTPLRSGCSADDEVVATLPAGTPIELRFRLSDGSDCFKISATVSGRYLMGCLRASALSGVAMLKEVRSASGPVSYSTPPPVVFS